MLFNSHAFLFAFLPATCLIYFGLNRWLPGRAGLAWLFGASCFFYAWWDWRFLPLLLGSIAFNFFAGAMLQRRAAAWESRHHGGATDVGYGPHKGKASRRGGVSARSSSTRTILAFAIAANLGLLAYFKYANFFATNVNAALGTEWTLSQVILPLGISFFTFTQVAFLVDAYRGQARELSFVNYGLFVSFFPHLLAGPILHHSEMMPQFAETARKRFSAANFWVGLTLLIIGLAKKVLIADELAPWSNTGFSQAQSLGFVDAWVAALAFTLQIYFDFSGYTDMALGMAWMLNIRLPLNFASPYQSRNIQEFWRRWHMTLSRFLRDYLYIPMGGNRRGPALALVFIVVTFTLGGLWHGANWTFVVWGVLNGVAVAAVHLIDRAGWSLPRGFAWALTIVFTVVAWVFFRASSLADALHILQVMFGIHGIAWHPMLPDWAPLFARTTYTRAGLNAHFPVLYTAAVMLAGFAIAWFATSSQTLLTQWQWTARQAAAVAMLAIAALLNLDRVTEFLYFNF